MEHTNDPETCQACLESRRPVCTKCGHALTGEFDYHGRTVCVACGEFLWVGIGDSPD